MEHSMNEHHTDEPSQATGPLFEQVSPRNKSSVLKLTLPLLAIIALVAGGGYFMRQQAIVRQDENAELLKSLGVVTAKDSTRTFVETVIVPPAVSLSLIHISSPRDKRQSRMPSSA